MFTVTDEAHKNVKNFFEGKELKPVRVFLNNGCGGPQLAMAVDQAKPEDEIFEFGGIEYIMEKELLSKAAPVTIDFISTGFSIKTSLELGGGCSSCGTQGSCCS